MLPDRTANVRPLRFAGSGSRKWKGTRECDRVHASMGHLSLILEARGQRWRGRYRTDGRIDLERTAGAPSRSVPR